MQLSHGLKPSCYAAVSGRYFQPSWKGNLHYLCGPASVPPTTTAFQAHRQFSGRCSLWAGWGVFCEFGQICFCIQNALPSNSSSPLQKNFSRNLNYCQVQEDMPSSFPSVRKEGRESDAHCPELFWFEALRKGRVADMCFLYDFVSEKGKRN